MQHLEAIVKALSVILVTLAPWIKPLFDRRADRARHHDEHYKRLKAFFDDGGTARHPMLVEASFAAVVGHAKLSSQEVELLLRQRRPTAFMATYMRCRDYIGPNGLGDRFELRGPAARPTLRKTLVTLGKLAYIVFAGTAFWTLVYVVAPHALQHGWSALAAAAVCAMGVMLGVVALLGSSKLHHASKLFKQQVLPVEATLLTTAAQEVFPVLLDDPMAHKSGTLASLADSKMS